MPFRSAWADEAAKSADVKYVDGRGIFITSPDKDFQFRFGGYVQADGRAFIGEKPANNYSQALIRSARPVFEMKLYNQFSARLMLDYGSHQAALLDAYVDYNATDALNFRAGKFKDPIGLERWQTEHDVLFVERGMTTNLVPYRDKGFGLYGNVIPGRLEYQLALTDGAPDLVNINNSPDNDTTVTGRIMAHPFAGSLKGLGLGFASSYGTHDASTVTPYLTKGYVTPAQSKFFSYSSGSFASGEQWRINPQLMYYNGPFSVLGEYVLEDQGVMKSGGQAYLKNSAWEAITTYVLTGEEASFSGVVPKHYFDPKNNQWGAFELVARVSQLHVDDAAFPAFASLSTSAKEALETTFGGTWYLNPNIKFNLDFEITSFEGGATGNGNRPTEKAVLSRAQFRF